MIREIRVTNLALIDDLALEFASGMHVFTGETGAGKSILMDAVGLLAGERAFSEQIRAGADEADISGAFELSSPRTALRELLAAHEIPFEDGALVIRRKVQRTGRNRIHVNDVPVTQALLKQIGDLAVDLHGQHDHQSLLNPETARVVIDSLESVAPVAAKYSAAWTEVCTARGALEEHDRRAERLRERRDVLEFQQKELSALQLKAGDEAAMEQELKLLESSSERAGSAEQIARLLRGTEASVENALASVRKRVSTLARLDPQFEPWVRDLESAQSTLTELATFCEAYLERAGEQADPARLESINDRLARVQRLKKKYGCSADQLAEKLARVRTDLAALENVDADREELARVCKQAEARVARQASELRTARDSASRPFDRKVAQQMTLLGFDGAGWKTEYVQLEHPGPKGAEDILFMVRTNPGEPFLALSRTASGGEISRLMLAIKTVLAERDHVPVLVFDEIDTGIGGTVAHEVARSLKALSASHQVLCISHLHQIASVADHHYQVSKHTVSGRTVTRVRALTREERVDEVARMLGGDTTSARNHAAQLLKSARQL